MKLADYFANTRGIGVLATSDAWGKVDLAIYSKPYVIDEEHIAFSMLERRTFVNLDSNPKAAYMFVEEGEGYKGKRFYIVKLGEESDAKKIEEIKKQHKKRFIDEETAKHLLYFRITETRPLVGGT